MGSWVGESCHVIYASAAGPRAHHTAASFRRDGDYCQEVLDRLTLQQPNVSYIGEWHTHPMDCGVSGTDIESLKWIARNPKYDQPEPLLVLLRRMQNDRWELNSYVVRRSGAVEACSN